MTKIFMMTVSLSDYKFYDDSLTFSIACVELVFSAHVSLNLVNDATQNYSIVSFLYWTAYDISEQKPIKLMFEETSNMFTGSNLV